MPTKPSKALETFDNPHPQRDYIIAIEIPEFTCLCPKTGQPDFATLYLQYVPDRKCVELKSLKLYIWSYRDEGAFHEDVTNTILNDLVTATQPRYMRLRSKFRVRGGIYTTVIAEHRKPGWTRPPPPPDYLPHWPRASVDSGSSGPESKQSPARTTTTASRQSGSEAQTPAFSELPIERWTTSDGETTPATHPTEPDSVYVGIDLGTNGCRAVAINEKGDILAQADALIPAPLKNQEQITQDPTEWWKAVSTALGAVFTKIDAGRVHALAVDGTSGTVLLCDRKGHPVTPALMYNDGRAVAQAEMIGDVAGHNCGAQGPTSSLAKLLWLQAKKMDTRAKHVLHQADWIVGRLTGLWGHSDHNSCLTLGFDPEQLEWPQWFSKLHVNTQLLPTTHVPGDSIGTVSAETAKAFGLSPDTHVVAGTTHGVATVLSAGASLPGQGVTSLGARLRLKLVSDKPVFSLEHGVYSHRVGRLWLAGGNSNSGGAVLLQYFDTAQVMAMTPQLDPENFTGLNYYPLPEIGECFPTNDPKLAPKLEPLPGDSVTFLQGMLEGLASIEAKGYRLLARLGAPDLTQVITTGGGSGNPAWQRIRERMLGVETKIAHVRTAAYGTALLAAGVVSRTFSQPKRTGTAG